jgi:hypothetical protein
MIKLFLRFLREILLIPEEKISGELHLYENIDHAAAKNFWSDISQIPVNRFWSTNLVSKSSQGKRPINRLPYGTIAIRVSGRKLFHQVMGMIDGLTE